MLFPEFCNELSEDAGQVRTPNTTQTLRTASSLNWVAVKELELSP